MVCVGDCHGAAADGQHHGKSQSKPGFDGMAGNAPPEFQPCFLPVYAEPLEILFLCGRVGVTNQYEHVQTASVKDAHPSFGHFSLLQKIAGFCNEFPVVCFVESLRGFFCQFRHLC